MHPAVRWSIAGIFIKIYLSFHPIVLSAATVSDDFILYSLPIYVANLFYPLPGILNKGIDAIKSSFSRGHLLLIG